MLATPELQRSSSRVSDRLVAIAVYAMVWITSIRLPERRAS
jgi:hypothetical protein